MPYLNQLKDISGDTVYPVTVAGGVYVSGTKTLDAELNDKMDKNGHSVNRVLVTDNDGAAITSTITAEELSMLSGINDTPIQTQLNNIQSIANSKQQQLRVHTYRHGTVASPLNYIIGENGRVTVDNIFNHNIPQSAHIYSVQCTDIRGYLYPFTMIYLDTDYTDSGSGTVLAHRGDIIIQGFPDATMRAWHIESNITITSIRVMVVYSLDD